MAVLTIDGKQIDWNRPPKPTARVKWSQTDMYGRPVTGSFRTIAFLDHLDTLARKKYNAPVVVIQPPYNTGVAASAGTHDYDAGIDWYIPGVPWAEQQRFARANGMADWWRKPPSFSNHQHGFPLPPREGSFINDDFAAAGFKVGKYIDGGWSLYGRAVGSSQLSDYYDHRNALSGHAYDPSWFPAKIEDSIFVLHDYIVRQRRAQVIVPQGADELAVFVGHAPAPHLGGGAGQALWDRWEVNVKNRMTNAVRNRITSVFVGDTNKHGRLPNLGAGLRRIGGRGIDLTAVRPAKGGARVKVLARKVVDLHIDGHDGHGTKVKVTFPSGKSVKFWLVHANLGRGATSAEFRRACWDLRRAFGLNAVYAFNEIDEADVPNETKILNAAFPKKHFAVSGQGTKTPTYVGRRRLRIKRRNQFLASPGLPRVAPNRILVKTVIAPK